MIKLYKDNNWIEITDEIIITNFQDFLQNNNCSNDIKFIKSGHYEYYIIIDDVKYPIADWDNVYVFLSNTNKPNWYKARPYQSWAFYDFIYKNVDSVLYSSKNSNIIDSVELPFDDIESNIIFKMHYNENKSISYERNDYYKTNVKISNNDKERSYYLGFYNRITSDIF
jgi:hypothetical protein